MSYLTVEVEIDHGRISARGAETLPEEASGLLTILNPPPLSQPRPIGLAKGQFTVPDDFNAPLPEDVHPEVAALTGLVPPDTDAEAEYHRHLLDKHR
jgi:hypothetical protein